MRFFVCMAVLFAALTGALGFMGGHIAGRMAEARLNESRFDLAEWLKDHKACCCCPGKCSPCKCGTQKACKCGSMKPCECRPVKGCECKQPKCPVGASEEWQKMRIKVDWLLRVHGVKTCPE